MTPLPFRLVVPTPGVRSARRQRRKPARGLTLVCMRVQPSRLHGPAVKNINVDFRDAGAGGVRFVSSEAVAVGSLLDLQVREDATGRVLAARGETTWIETRGENGRDVHLVGVRFIEILTSRADASWFFDDFAGSPMGPAQVPAPVQQKRGPDRFAVGGCEVTLERDHRFRGSAKAGNLAIRILDLSRSGAQVLCGHPLGRGERVRLTIDVRSLQEIFTAEAEVVWVRHPGIGQEFNWRVGLAFQTLDHSQERRLLSLEHWFQGARNPGLRKPHP